LHPLDRFHSTRAIPFGRLGRALENERLQVVYDDAVTLVFNDQLVAGLLTASRVCLGNKILPLESNQGLF